MSGFKLNTDKTAAVSLEAFWVPVGPSTPRGVNMWLISKPAGVSQKGMYDMQVSWLVEQNRLRGTKLDVRLFLVLEYCFYLQTGLLVSRLWRRGL